MVHPEIVKVFLEILYHLIGYRTSIFPESGFWRPGFPPATSGPIFSILADLLNFAFPDAAGCKFDLWLDPFGLLSSS